MQSGAVLFEAIKKDNSATTHGQCIGGTWIEKEEYYNWASIPNNFISGVFTAPLSGYYEFQFKARAIGTDTSIVKTCVILYKPDHGPVLSRSCNESNEKKTKASMMSLQLSLLQSPAAKLAFDFSQRISNYEDLTLSGIIRLSNGDKICAILEEGKLDVTDREFMQFSGKYIGPSS